MTSKETFDACAACHCLVKREDATCPFCGAAQERSVRQRAAECGVRARGAAAPRRSRAAWLALGSVLGAMGAAGCSSSTGSGGTPSTRPAALATDPTFTCGDQACDAVVEYCAYVSHVCPEGQTGGGDDYDCKSLDTVDLTAIPLCGHATRYSQRCRTTTITDASGHAGIELDSLDAASASSCRMSAGCYGAPPPRPERSAAARPDALAAMAARA